MGSNWRANFITYGFCPVTNLGTGHLKEPVRCCARMLTDFAGWYLFNNGTLLSNGCLIGHLPFVADGQYFYTVIAKNGQPHFPYGYDVEAD